MQLLSVVAVACAASIGTAHLLKKWSLTMGKAGTSDVVAEADGVHEVTALEKEWVEIARTHHLKVLDHILADGFVFVFSDGKLAGREAMYDLLRDSGSPPSTVTVLDFQVHVFAPNVIVVTSVDDIRERGPGGKVLHHQERDTDTWVLMGHRWLCVAEQTTLVAAPVS